MRVADNEFSEIKGGSRVVFETLFKELYARLCVYAESIIHDRDMAEDIVQNIFCQLWEKRDEITITDSLKSYLYRSVYNAALNTLKHEKVRLAFSDFIQKHGKVSENEIEYLFDQESRDLLIRRINEIIERLPSQCRDIFLLSRFAGKKNVEIAQELHISIRTVETQLYRAMKRLREDLVHLRNSEILFFFFFSTKS